MIPGRGRVLLRRVESGESYPGGQIIIPEPVRDALMAQHAEVVAVGQSALCEDFERCPRPEMAHLLSLTGGLPVHYCSVKLGDWVLVAKRAGVECGDETGKSYLVTVDDILAILEP